LLDYTIKLCILTSKLGYKILAHYQDEVCVIMRRFFLCFIAYFPNDCGIITAVTSPVAQIESSANTSTFTLNFFGWISSTCPTAFKTIPSGVGFTKSTWRDAVTKRGGSSPLPGSKPFFRCRASDAEPVPWQSISEAINPPLTR